METEEIPKRHVLCYGDSNTWGYVPAGGGQRMPSNVRWPGVVSKLLRINYRITEEGLGGRTTVWNDPFIPGVDRNGLATLGTILESHKPLDLVIFFLGTNDLKTRFGVAPEDVALGVESLVTAARRPEVGPGTGEPPAVLVICPCTIWEVPTQFGGIFRGGQEKSLELRNAFTQMAARIGVPLLCAEDFVHSDPSDGIHLSAESHGVLGQEVAKWILEWFGA